MFPIYGMGAFLAPIGQAVDRWLTWEPGQALSLRDRVMRHGALYMVLIFIMEYISGSWLRARGMCPWDYTGRNSNVCVPGIIRAATAM